MRRKSFSKIVGKDDDRIWLICVVISPIDTKMAPRSGGLETVAEWTKAPISEVACAVKSSDG